MKGMEQARIDTVPIVSGHGLSLRSGQRSAELDYTSVPTSRFDGEIGPPIFLLLAPASPVLADGKPASQRWKYR